jgi:hypothetical protein
VTPLQENRTGFYFLEYINNLPSNVNKIILFNLKIFFTKTKKAAGKSVLASRNSGGLRRGKRLALACSNIN